MNAQTVVMPAVTPEMLRYSWTLWILYFAATFYSWAVLVLLLRAGVSARIRNWAERVAKRPFLVLPLYYVPFALIVAALNAPLVIYGDYWVDHAYRLSHQSFAGWLADSAKGFAVDTIVTLLALALVFWVMRRSPRRWGLWFWAAMIPVIAVGIFLEPLLIDPLFNSFHPMPPSPLRTKIEALEVRAGIPNTPILIADKSRQTEETNAYVTGIGSSARIVIWDTTLRRMDDDEVLAILGHEMGHYVLHHIVVGFFEAVVLLLVAFPLGQWLYERLLRRWGSTWRLRGPTDIAAIPALLLVLAVLTFLSDPVTNALSRRIEHQADAFGLKVTGNRIAMARAFVALSQENLSDPNPPPFIRFWLFTHPTLQERVDFALGRKSPHSLE